MSRDFEKAIDGYTPPPNINVSLECRGQTSVFPRETGFGQTSRIGTSHLRYEIMTSGSHSVDGCHRRSKSMKKTWLIIGIVSVAFLGGIGVGRFWQLQDDSRLVLLGIAKRLDVAPAWEDVRRCVYCQLLEPGMSRDEVAQKLSLIGLYQQIEDDYDSRIIFLEFATRWALSPLDIKYDGAGRLRWIVAGDFNYGPQTNCEPSP